METFSYSTGNVHESDRCQEPRRLLWEEPVTENAYKTSAKSQVHLTCFLVFTPHLFFSVRTCLFNGNFPCLFRSTPCTKAVCQASLTIADTRSLKFMVSFYGYEPYFEMNTVWGCVFGGMLDDFGVGFNRLPIPSISHCQ